MSVRSGAIALVLALCAVSVHSQVWGYVSQSFSLVRSDILEAANYELVANISNRDAGEVIATSSFNWLIHSFGEGISIFKFPFCFSTAQNYEERLYPANKWACTARTVPKTESSPTRSMFVDLFRYFAGDNSASKIFYFRSFVLFVFFFFKLKQEPKKKKCFVITFESIVC